MLHDADRTDFTCFFIAHEASDRTVPPGAGGVRERGERAASSQSAAVPPGFRFAEGPKRRSRRR